MSLKDHVVLMTGSSGGIGSAVIDALRAQGALIIGADRAPKEDQELAASFPLDVTSEEQSAAVVRDITSMYGRIDALIHAAGVLAPPRTSWKPRPKNTNPSCGSTPPARSQWSGKRHNQ